MLPSDKQRAVTEALSDVDDSIVAWEKLVAKRQAIKQAIMQQPVTGKTRALKQGMLNQFFRLRRYNGKSHEHTNHIECESFYDFHVHLAPERYQNFGTREDAYAEPTERYSDFRGAVQYLIDDVNLEISPQAQNDLFGEG